MDLNVKMEDDEDHQHSLRPLHQDLGPVVPYEEIPPPPGDSPMDLEDHESTRKRLAFDEFPDDDDGESAKRQRKLAPPPKKLNDDQWAEMFSRLIRYKEQHGVSPFFRSVGFVAECP